MTELMFILFFSLLAAGQEPKPGSKEAVQQMQQKVVDTTQTTSIQVENLRKGFITTRSQLDVLITQLNGISEEMSRVKIELSIKDMSRVAVLERDLQAIRDARDRREIQQRQDQADFMAWVRPVTVAVVTSLLLTFFTGILGFLRHKSVASSLTVLKTQTNGMSERIASLSHKEGFLEGEAAEKDKQDHKIS